MTRPDERSDPTEGVSEPSTPTPHRPWVRVVTVILLVAFVLSIVVGSLLA